MTTRLDKPLAYRSQSGGRDPLALIRDRVAVCMGRDGILGGLAMQWAWDDVARDGQRMASQVCRGDAMPDCRVHGATG